MSRLATQGESFQIQRRGDIVILVPSPEVESMTDSMVEQAAQLVLVPLKDDPPSGVIFDLSQVNFFGSLTIALSSVAVVLYAMANGFGGGLV